MTHPKDEITSAITPPPASALPRKTNRLNWEELDNNKDKLLSFLNQDNPAKWWERKTPEMLHIAVLRFNESKHPNSKATLETIASHPSIKQYINQPHMGMKQTPLYAAVSSGNVEAVRILVKNNADPTIGDIRYNRTPLSQTNNPEIIKILSQSSKPEGKLEEPETPEGAVSPDQTKYLKIKKLPTNLPIDIMSKIKELGYINTKGNVNPQPFWEKLYEDIEAKDDIGRTALECAISRGKADVVKLLLDNNADPNICGKDRKTPLQIAQAKYDATPANEKAKISNILTINKNDRKYQGVIKLSPHEVEKKIEEARKLIADQAKKDLEIIQLLRKYGATEDIRNVNDETQTQLEIPTGEDQSLQTPETKLEKPELLQPPVSEFEPENAQTKTTSEEEITKIFQSVRNGELPELGEDFDINYKNAAGYTLLHYAVYYKSPNLENLIARYKPNLNTQNEFGETPLHLAAENGDLDTVKLLINLKADSTLTDLQHHTPLHFAAKKQHEAVAEYLETISGSSVKKLSADDVEVVMSHITALRAEYLATISDSSVNKLSADDLLVTKHYVENLEDYLEDGNFRFGLKYDINVRCFSGDTMLYVAAWHGKSDLVSFLLEHGADPNCLTQYGHTPLHRATEKGHKEIVKILLTHGADPNCFSKYYATPLQIAREKGYEEIAKILLENIAIQDISNSNKTQTQLVSESEPKNAQAEATPEEKIAKIFQAVQDGELPELGADFNINYQNTKGNTLLHFAVEYENPHLAHFISTYKPDLNIQNNLGETILHFAACKGHLGTVELLVQHNADPKIANFKGDPPLNLAVINGFIAVAEYLIPMTYTNSVTSIVPNQELSAETAAKNLVNPSPETPVAAQNTSTPTDKYEEQLPESQNQVGSSNHPQSQTNPPLYEAAQEQDLQKVQDLLKQGVNVNAHSNTTNNTALHIAVRNKNVEIVKLLLENGADVDLENKSGVTALHLVVYNNNVEMVKLVLEKSKNVNQKTQYDDTALHLAVFNNNVKMVELLLEKGADVNLINSRTGDTALHLAVFNNNVKMVELLLEKKADVNIKNACNGGSALHTAIRNKNVGIVKLLLEKKADVNITNACSGDAALHLAVWYNQLEMAELLLKKKADVNITNARSGDAALHTAVRDRNIAMVELLINNGAIVTDRNFKSRSLYHNEKIVTLLKTAYNAQHPDNAQHPAHSWFSIDIGSIFSWVKSWLSGGNENNTEHSHNQDDAHSSMSSHDSEHSSEASTGWLNSIFSFFSNLWSPGPSDHHPEPNTSVVGDNHVPPVGEPHE